MNILVSKLVYFLAFLTICAALGLCVIALFVIRIGTGTAKFAGWLAK